MHDLPAPCALIASLLICFPRLSAAQEETQCGIREGTPCTVLDLRVAALSAGRSHTCAIDRSGVAYCWGDGLGGALGSAQLVVGRFPVRVSDTARFTQVAAGGDFTCGVLQDSTLRCWGKSQAVPGWPAPQAVPRQLATESKFVSVSSGARHACALDRDGNASCWGWNVDGETGIGSAGIDAALIPQPTFVLGQHRFMGLSAGAGFTCGVDVDFITWCWGSNAHGILGDQASEQCGDVNPLPCSSRPVRIAMPEAVKVSAGTGHACALTRGGAVYCWGENGSGQLGFFDQSRRLVREPRRVPLPAEETITEVSSGGLKTCALSAQQRLHCWGSDMVNLGGRVLDPQEYGPRLLWPSLRYRSVSVGSTHMCAVDLSGQLFCWGDTVRGAFGRR